MAERTPGQERLAHHGRILTWLAAIVAALVSAPAWLYGCFASSMVGAGVTPSGSGLGCHTPTCLDDAVRGALVSLGFASLAIVWIILSAWSRRTALGLATALAAAAAGLLILLALAPVAGTEGVDPWLLALAALPTMMGLASGMRWRGLP